MARCDQCERKVKTVNRQRIGKKVIYQICESCGEAVKAQEISFAKEELDKLEEVNK